MAPFTAKTKLPASLGQTCYFRLSSSQFGLTFKLWWTKHPTPLSNAVLLHSSENCQSSFPCTNGVYDFNQPIIDQSTVQQRPSVMQRFSEKQLISYRKQARQHLPTWFPSNKLLHHVYDCLLKCNQNSRWRREVGDDGLFGNGIFLVDTPPKADKQNQVLWYFRPITPRSRSYLSSRNLVPQVNSCISHPRRVTSGVTQGSA